MSMAAELALIREAFAALPEGTPQERTAWILQRKRELQSEAPVSTRTRPIESRVKPFSQVADDPKVVKSQENG